MRLSTGLLETPPRRVAVESVFGEVLTLDLGARSSLRNAGS
jgi:hypothetical protein